MPSPLPYPRQTSYDRPGASALSKRDNEAYSNVLINVFFLLFIEASRLRFLNLKKIININYLGKYIRKTNILIDGSGMKKNYYYVMLEFITS